MGRAPSDPPSAHCLSCDAWQGERRRRRWSIAVASIIVSALLSLAVTAGTSCSRAVTLSATVEQQGQAQDAALRERQTIQARQAAAELESAQRWGRVETTLARLEERLAAMAAERRDR